MINTYLKYDKIVRLFIHQKYYFEDGLSVELTSFSHKRSLTGGPTKATAYLDPRLGSHPIRHLL
jgi:hypothetical protein